MKIQEFSDAFDTLLNSYNTQADFGEQASRAEVVLDEYEKSVFLTQAQDIVVKSFFDRKKNSTGDGFDDTTERQVDFSSLIKVASLQPYTGEDAMPFDDRGIIYQMPPRKHPVEQEGQTVWVEEAGTTDVLFILNEKLVTEKPVGESGSYSKDYVVVPLNYKEYDREMSKPYAQPKKKQAWRMFQNNSTGFDIKSELIPIFNLTANESIEKYVIRYVRRPCPIIVADLPDGLEIDGFTKAQDCELNPILHPEILQRAVELAISTRGGQRVARADNNA